MILALDLASKTGFAMGEAGCGVPISWTDKLKDADDEPVAAVRNLGRKLGDIFASTRITLCIFEAPPSGAQIARWGKSRSETGDFLQKLAGCAHGVAAHFRVKSAEVSVHTVRKTFIGTAKHHEPKKATIAQCKAMGWGQKRMDHNEADALAVWFYAVTRHHPDLAPQVGPLFVGRID